MDPLAHKVAAHFLSKEDVRKRIEAIPGWQRSNFLQSLWRQVETRALSPKQTEILEKIEGEQKGKIPGGHADVRLDPRKEWMERSSINDLVRALANKSPITVYDPRGLIAPNHQLQGHLVHELAADFWGEAERYAENNADEDDPKRHDFNSDMRRRHEEAGKEMEHAKLHAKQDGPMTTLTLTPSYKDVLRKHKILNL